MAAAVVVALCQRKEADVFEHVRVPPGSIEREDAV
jgi:hypothetical protein